ncbi:hypothetical protein PLESTB_000521500 [Pleodorina starrii]|uniref:Uncharacterized protein n=1 Tax=Pleodorina starrii TaxID=330485 RepID=A0A9W6F0R9_9CHLO|nr:hypothetical protein PLESTM_000385000 [Pleodorina starrii]GLC51615.1 hypothetical protein PLESTB_000521500 [Pleodorina starrii]GLC72384.1 hypothetical protein PLESTF_001241800 [Pleodorina starrii]
MADQVVADCLGEEDLGLLRELLNNALSALGPCDCTHVEQAAEAVLTVLSGGNQVDLLSQPQQGTEDDALAPQPPAAGEVSTVAELGSQVLAAVERVSTLRRQATDIVLPALAAQLEALRPAQESGEIKLLTPGRPERAISTETDGATRAAASAANVNLIKAADKLPALKARIEEVSGRMTRVMGALEEQKVGSKAQATPTRAAATATCAADSDWVIGVIARMSRQ